jgi:hypothetical protein
LAPPRSAIFLGGHLAVCGAPARGEGQLAAATSEALVESLEALGARSMGLWDLQGEERLGLRPGADVCKIVLRVSWPREVSGWGGRCLHMSQET